MFFLSHLLLNITVKPKCPALYFLKVSLSDNFHSFSRYMNNLFVLYK